MTTHRCFLLFLCVCAGLAHGAAQRAWSIQIEKADWEFRSPRAQCVDGMLHLQARGRKQTLAFYKKLYLRDAVLEASFYVKPGGRGVHAVGFIVGSSDSLNFYYVHYDHAQAILCRADADGFWHEIGRRSGLDKPEGQWHTARVACKDHNIEVWLNGKKLYCRPAPELSAGRIGFYAGQADVTIRDVRVSGIPVAPSSPWQWKERPHPWRTVCSNGGNGGYEAFPDVCRLANGNLMTVFYDGWTHISVPGPKSPRGGRISACISKDDGDSWGRPFVLFDGPYDDRDPHIAQLRDGRLLLTFFCHRTAKIPGWNGAMLSESRDGGKTWSAARVIAPGHYVSAPVREMPDGTLFLGLYKVWPGGAGGAVTRSLDGGKTWSTPTAIDSNGMRLDAETDLIRLANGELFAALRGRKQMAWSRSTDNGETWSPAVSFGFPGHCPYLLRTSKNIILLAHRLPGTALHYSLDEARTWHGPVRIDRVGGAYPSLVERRDGSILCVYYEEGAGSDIRAVRLRVKPSGVKIIDFDDKQATATE